MLASPSNTDILPLIVLKVSLLPGTNNVPDPFWLSCLETQNHLPSWKSFVPLNERNIIVQYMMPRVAKGVGVG